jgi:hypothetical protein
MGWQEHVEGGHIGITGNGGVEREEYAEVKRRKEGRRRERARMLGEERRRGM